MFRTFARHFPHATLPALVLGGLLAGAGLYAPDRFEALSLHLSHQFNHAFGWLVLWSSSLLLFGCLALAVSPLGRLKLGKPDEQPEFGFWSWLAMLFAAGMGAGLLFWGVAEPMTHYLEPPQGWSSSDPAEQAAESLALTFFHWTLHPWGIYAAGALAVGYIGFRHDRPLLPSMPLRGMFPAKGSAVLRRGLDSLAVVAVALGIAATIAQGITQMSAGLDRLWPGEIPRLAGQGGLVAGLTLVALLSASTPLGQGVRRLSLLNMALAIGLMIWLVATGPIGSFTMLLGESVGRYLEALPELSFRLQRQAGEGSRWGEDWTVVYLLSWVAWTPFVAMFIARISRGRSIREFVFGVVLAPSLFSILWFVLLGGTAFASGETAGIFRLLAEHRVDDALFALFAESPFARWLWVAVLLLLFLFIVTGVDSAIFVLASLAEGGSRKPSNRHKLAWGMVLGLLMLMLLLGQGGVAAIRAAVSLGAVPLFFLLLLQCVGLVRALWRDHRAACLTDLPVPICSKTGVTQGK